MPRQQNRISPAMKEYPRKSREYNLWCGLERNGLLLNSFFSKNIVRENQIDYAKQLMDQYRGLIKSTGIQRPEDKTQMKFFKQFYNRIQKPSCNTSFEVSKLIITAKRKMINYRNSL